MRAITILLTCFFRSLSEDTSDREFLLSHEVNVDLRVILTRVKGPLMHDCALFFSSSPYKNCEDSDCNVDVLFDKTNSVASHDAASHFMS